MECFSLMLAFVSVIFVPLICGAIAKKQDKLYDGELLHE